VGILGIKRELGDLNRLRQIITILIEQGFHEHVSGAGLLKHATLKGHVKRLTTPKASSSPQHARETLEALGPTFIKLGQVLSLRPDLVPSEYCEEFKKLQDNVPAVETAEIKRIVEQELGKPIHEIFSEFSDAPLAAASVGQVHKAKLKDGTVVVVKIQRPGIHDIMMHDIDIMEYLARKVDDSQYSYIHASAIVAEFRRYTERELDLTFEMRNLKKFHEFFKKDKQVVIPQVYEQHCTSKLLVMEFLDGIPLKEKERIIAEGFSLKKLVQIDVEATFRQAFELGIFHADPHPGNILILRKGRSAALGFIDFGIVGFLDEEMRRYILRLFMALTEGDIDEIIDVTLKLGKAGPAYNAQSLRQQLATLVMDWQGTNLREEKLSMLVYKTMQEAMQHDIDISPDVILLAKAFVTVEGTASWLDPELDLAKALHPLLSSYASQQLSPRRIKKEAIAAGRKMEEIGRELPTLTKSLLEHVKDGQFTLKIEATELNEAEHMYDLEATKRNLTMFGGMLFIGSAVFAGFAPAVGIAGVPFYMLGVIGVVIVGMFYIRVRRKISNQIDR
jgi:ubiquinone biosynthesis protein